MLKLCRARQPIRVSTQDADFARLRHLAAEAQHSGDLDLASSLWQQVLSARPNEADAWFRLGQIALSRNQLDLAAEQISTALGHDPKSPTYHFVLAIVRQDQGRLGDAQFHLQRALEIAPGFVQAHNNLGLVQLDRGDAAGAVQSFRKAIALKSDYAGAWNHLGIALRAMGDGLGALGCFQRAAMLSPQLVDARVNWGAMLMSQGDAQTALSILEEARLLNPVLAGTHFLIAKCHAALGAVDVVIQSLRETLRLDGGHGDARCMLARELALIGRYHEAVSLYETEQIQRPDSLQAALGMHLTVPYIALSSAETEAARRRVLMGMEQIASAQDRYRKLPKKAILRQLEWTNFFLAYQGKDDRSFQQAYGDFVSDLLGYVLPEFMQSLPLSAQSGRRIKIGFASSFFRRCTAGNYFSSWVTDIDRSRFEVFFYRVGGKSDSLTDELASVCDHSVALTGTLSEMASRIGADQLDILVYPEVGMESRTFLLAALRLAPVQCAGWGHPVTTGLRNVDFFLSCAAMEPAHAQAHYREKLVTLPGIGTRYQQPRYPNEGQRKAFGLPEGKTLYLFPHSLFKIHPDNDAIVARILENDSSAVLVICEDRHPDVTTRFLKRLDAVLASHGLQVDERRIVVPSLAHDEYLMLNRVCDLMLDTLYWSGGNTSLDALACGLPVVTLPGELMRSRQSMAMLKICGLEQLIACDVEDFVRIAKRLGCDASWRDTLHKNLMQSVGGIFDRDEPIESLEAFFINVLQAAR